MKWTIANTEGNGKKHIIIVLVSFCAITVAAIIGNLFFVVTNSSVAESPSWLDPAWTQQGALTIDNSTNATTLSNYQISATIDTATLITAGQMKSDCSDLRVTDSDGTSLLNFWVVDGTCNTATTQIWTKVPSIPASSTTSIYLYYGNAAATSISSWDNTILPYSDTELTPNFGSPRYDGGLLNYDGKLWIFGGRINGSGTGSRVNDVWSSTDGVTWSQIAATSSWGARSAFGYVVFNNKMWILGGLMDGTVRKNDVWSSTDGITWTQETSAANWGIRDSLGYTVFNNKMWVMGGTNGAKLNDVWSSSDGITWTQETAAANWPIRSLFAVTTFNNKMWIFGGAGATTYNDVWSSSDGITWTQETAAAAWSIRNGLRVAVLDNKMWITGGFGSSVYKNDLWYSSDGITWTSAVTNGDWHARTSLMMTTWNDKLILAGGTYFSGSSVSLTDIWQMMRTYTTPAPTVTGVLYTMPTAPSGLAAATPGTDQATLSWTDNSHNETGFTIKKSTDGITYDTFSTTAANATTAIVNTLTPNTQYWFQVFATGPSANPTPSTTGPITTLATIPTSITASADSSMQITVSWSGIGSQWYVENTTASTTSNWTTSTSYTFQNLNCGTVYAIHIKGKNSAGVETNFSDPVNVQTNSCGGGLSISGAISIPGGNETYSPIIELNLAATGATQMILSEDPDFKNAYWQALKSTTTFTLSSGVGEKTIYVMFGSTANITSQKYQVKVILKEPLLEAAPDQPVTPPKITEINPIELTPTPITIINPPSRIYIYPIEEKEYIPNSSVDYVYRYRNKSNGPLYVKIVRQVVDANGKISSTVNNRMTIKKGQTILKTAKNYLNSELNGVYKIRIRIFNRETGKLLDENKFNIVVT